MQGKSLSLLKFSDSAYVGFGHCLVYVAKVPSTAASFNGQGAVWTKIYSSGLINAQSQQWATDVVNTNSGELGSLLSSHGHSC